jgi:hypothetical protein
MIQVEHGRLIFKVEFDDEERKQILEMAFWAHDSIEDHFQRMLQRAFEFELKEYREAYKRQAEIDAQNMREEMLNGPDWDKEMTPEEEREYEEACAREEARLLEEVRKAKAEHRPIYVF